jgi:predicted phosphate transport protein (TIGR00153 family)
MSWLTSFFKPRQDNFMKLLIEQADYAVKGLEALRVYAANGDTASADAVQRYEKEADEVRRILVDELNRTFVTPMDREDISALSRAIDDILDYAYSTVGEMQVLHVTPTLYLQRMVSLLCEAAGEVHMAMLRLKDHPGVATDHAQRAKALENRVESVYREAIAALFEGPAEPEHIVEMLKLREIYRHLSNAADRGDEAANVISDVVVKMT